MAIFGVSIEKSASFRGATQIFANVYHYDSAGGAPSDANLESLLDALVVIEKTFHASSVTFVRGRVWSAGGSPAANQMRVDKSLSGTGALTNDVSYDRERAVLVRWRAGVDSRGRPVYLRKWWHVMSTTFAGAAWGSGVYANTAQIGSTQRNTFETTADQVVSQTHGSVFTMCGPSGRVITGDTIAHEYLEHHQLGETWRSV